MKDDPINVEIECLEREIERLRRERDEERVSQVFWVDGRGVLHAMQIVTVYREYRGAITVIVR